MASSDENSQGPGFQNLITPDGYRKIESELTQLFEVERPKLVEEVAVAAAHGDRSENAEYIYGKKRLREIDKRMNFLKRRLDIAKVIDPKTMSGDRIQFGAHVKIQNEETNAVKTWYIVGEDEADPGNGKISWQSPIGKGMMGKKIGDIFQVITPNGELEFSILEFIYK